MTLPRQWSVMVRSREEIAPIWKSRRPQLPMRLSRPASTRARSRSPHLADSRTTSARRWRCRSVAFRPGCRASRNGRGRPKGSNHEHNPYTVIRNVLDPQHRSWGPSVPGRSRGVAVSFADFAFSVLGGLLLSGDRKCATGREQTTLARHVGMRISSYGCGAMPKAATAQGGTKRVMRSCPMICDLRSGERQLRTLP